MAPVASELLRTADAGLVDIPKSAFQLRDQGSDVQIEQAGEKKKRTFKMVATSGKALAHWWFGTLVIDLAGISMKQSLPVLKDHDTNQRVGFTTSVGIDEKLGLVAEGQLLSNQFAQEILADHADGFPWQASIYLQASKIQYLEDGETAEVNGREVAGPAAIFRESTLREVTFCALGVDDDTSATPMSATSADTVAVHLSKRGSAMSKSTEAPVAPQPAPAPAPQDISAQLAAARNEGLTQERQRVLAILAQTGASQHDLALSLIDQGKSLQEALLAVNEDLRAKLAAKQATGATTESLAKGNSAQAIQTDEAAKLAAMPDGETKWKAQFAADAALRAEFGNDEKVFLAFKANEHRVRVSGRGR